jgi:hypothetical protein
MLVAVGEIPVVLAVQVAVELVVVEMEPLIQAVAQVAVLINQMAQLAVQVLL